MIVVDTSALAAIVLREPDRDRFRSAIFRARKSIVSTVSIVELRMVVYGRKGSRGLVQSDNLLKLSRFEITSPDRREMEAAFAAHLAYGKASGHPARLNFADLFSYALAKVRGLPLLFKGDDFARTDVVPALRPN